MLVYLGEKSRFLADVLDDAIDAKIEERMRLVLHHSVGKQEKSAWQQSMQYMHKVLSDPEIPADAGVAIEFSIPQTSKRVDFIISGLDGQRAHQAIIIELKQWSEVQEVSGVEGLLRAGHTPDSRMVRTFIGGALRDTVHPSYQVLSYRTLIGDFNANVQDIPIKLTSCAYLHNYEVTKREDPLFHPRFKEYIDESPVFCKGDARKLQQFIKGFIRHGDARQTLVYIENGDIRPSKSLQDALASMLRGNREFMLIDEQEIVFRKIVAAAKASADDHRKRVIIVTGGPGTGKSVVAVNALVRLIREKIFSVYVTKNSAPRYVFEEKLLQGAMKRRHISNLFKSSGAFVDSQENVFGALLVDEAHRLNRRTSFGPVVKGEDQVKEIIRSARLSVFFIDEHQRVTAQDHGTIAVIKRWAEDFKAQVIEDELASQFRCNGSDGYLAWLDHVLGIGQTAQVDLGGSIMISGSSMIHSS